MEEHDQGWSCHTDGFLIIDKGVTQATRPSSAPAPICFQYRTWHIVSFNCKHLVNDKRIDAFNAINFQNGYELIIDITTTPHRFIMDAEREKI
jgi:hypothetical protein